MNRLSVKKKEKSVTDLFIEKSIELFGVTPDERSDQNLEWMREHGYVINKKRKRGRRR